MGVKNEQSNGHSQAMDDTEQEALLDSERQEDDEASTAVRYSVSSYGADYPVDGLVKRLRQGDIMIPEFQRGYVWSWSQASRFVESLLVGLPVPGVFLSREPGSQKLLVIDGQQRLSTLQFFYDGILEGKEFKLRGVTEDFEGITYKTLQDEDRRRLDDSIVHATILRQDDPENDSTSIYLVFERLNSGGTPLSPQEIRSCVYQGEFCDLIGNLNDNSAWRELYGRKSKRARDEELILRFFALLYDLDSYKMPMKVFLSDFMAKNQHLKRFDEEELTRVFHQTVTLVAEKLGPGSLRPERGLNVAVTDAVLVATALRLRQGDLQNTAEYATHLTGLLESSAFLDKCAGGTTHEDNVRGRIALASGAIKSII